tara:strand:+ start:3831 stop:4145 length:315 start_codon:yes stop_codon:yes gene_type:complete
MSSRTKEQKARKVLYAAKRRDRRKHWLSNYKIAKGCSRCGYKEHAGSLDFDHTDTETKIRPVSRMTLGTIQNLILEVRKCVIMCKNCHQLKTELNREYMKKGYK